MKKSLIVFIIMTVQLFAFFNEKKLGAWYEVKRDDTHYVAVEGDMKLNELKKGIKVRLIKDDSVADQLIWAPLRIVKLMFLQQPRGTWLVEDDNGNRGYVWDNELSLIK